MNYETVSLKNTDPFEFEDLCSRILQKAGWGTVETLGGVADKGRDIIVTRPNGYKIVVECKHYPKSTVGRPVIQKLHSAVLTTRAKHGIVITTGKFSKAAVEHARTLTESHLKMELYDMPKLVELAASAGIRFSDVDAGLFSYPMLEASGLKRTILNTKIHSYPTKISDMIHVKSVSRSLFASYLVSVDVVQDFKTSIGTIYSIDERGMYYLFDASTGELFNIDRSTIDFTHLEEFHEQSAEYNVRKTDFKIDMTTLKDRIFDEAISEHTKRVVYQGKTRRKYEKVCTPGKRSIMIKDVKQVFMPIENAVLSALRHEYKYAAMHNHKYVMISNNGLRMCGICKKDTDSRQICNECGMITHRGKSHGFTCHVCDKTVCRRCVSYQSRFLFFKRNFCSDCKPEGVHKYN